MKPKQNRTEEIGIRELKARASAIVRSVREKRSRFLVTRRGRPEALIIPVDAEIPPKSADEVWERLEKLGEEIGNSWQSEKSAVEILSDLRR